MTESGTRSKDCKPKHYQEDNIRPKIPQVCFEFYTLPVFVGSESVYWFQKSKQWRNVSKYIEVTDRFKSQRSKSDDRSYVNDQYKQLFHPKSEGSQTSDLSPRVLRKMSSPSPGSFRRKIKDQQRCFVFIALIFIEDYKKNITKVSFQTPIIGPVGSDRVSSLPPCQHRPQGPFLHNDQHCVQRANHRVLLWHRHLPPL